jgi:D-alanyl-D-alanine carboxypeptidase
MSAFGSYLRTVMDLGRDEARQDGSDTVEAQHLLLAITAGPDEVPRQVLAAAGLDHQAVMDALDREFEHSLAAAGASAAAFNLPRASNSLKRPQLGASAKLAVERGFTGQKDPQPADLLLGILRAQAGTVPRALDLAGVDRDGLAQRTLLARADGFRR